MSQDNEKWTGADSPIPTSSATSSDASRPQAEPCPRRQEGGPCRWEPGPPGSPDWCYYCERERPAGEGALTIRNDTDEPVEFRVVPADEPRFGERLRRFARQYSGTHRINLDRIADAIDQDAATEIGRLERGQLERQRYLHQRAEALVEELRYTWGGAFETDRKDVLDAEPFLERLGAIFGECAKGPARLKPGEDAQWFEIPGRNGASGLQVAIQPNGWTWLWPVDPEVGEGFALYGEAARDLKMLLEAYLPPDHALVSPDTDAGASTAEAIMEGLMERQKAVECHGPAETGAECPPAGPEESR